MPRSRLSSLAALGAMALAALALGHELIYVIRHGTGEAYAVAMRQTGHDGYWAGFLMIVFAVTSALVAVTLAQIRRLRRLAAATRAGSVSVHDLGPSRFVSLLGPLWLRLWVAVVAIYLLQENLETASTGAGLPGLVGVVGGEHSMAIPVLLTVSLLVAAVGALVGWRREVIIARLRAAAQGRLRASTTAPRPTQVNDRPRSVVEERRNGVRAPPSGALAPA